jgi:Rrf2 family protein
MEHPKFMPIYSKTTQYAVSMLTQIAQPGKGKLSSVSYVSRATGISKPTVAKTLQVLVKEGLLDSRKGPGGGFHLAVSPELITLGRIFRAVERKEPFSECAAGLQSCSEDNVCPLHAKWKFVKQELIDFLDSTTLQEMVLAIMDSEVQIVCGKTRIDLQEK